MPEKYNEILNLMEGREIRACLPIQELNILLEPLVSQKQLLEMEMRTEEDTVSVATKSSESEIEIDDEEEESDNDDDDDSLVEVDDKSIGDDSNSNLSFENTNLINI